MKNNIFSRVGSEQQYGPRLAGEILHDYLENSDDALAVAYREHATDAEGWHTNTALAVNLKTILRSDSRTKTGKSYSGVLRRDEPSEEFNFDEHYTFVETLPTTEKRNPRIFNGRFITVTRRDNGSIRLNFKNLDTYGDFCIERYADGVRKEICQALEGLIEEEG